MYAIVTRRRELHLRFTPDTDSDVLVIAFLLFTFDLVDIIFQFQNSLRSKRFCGVWEQRITGPISCADKIVTENPVPRSLLPNPTETLATQASSKMTRIMVYPGVLPYMGYIGMCGYGFSAVQFGQIGYPSILTDFGHKKVMVIFLHCSLDMGMVFFF